MVLTWSKGLRYHLGYTKLDLKLVRDEGWNKRSGTVFTFSFIYVFRVD